MEYFEPITREIDEKMLSRYVNNITEFQKDVDGLREWCKKQPHFPEVPCDRKLENFFLLNKCRIEISKQKLDMYYSIRSRVPEIFSLTNPKITSIKNYMDINYWISLPKLTEKLSRVTVFKLIENDQTKFDPIKFFTLSLIWAEFRLLEGRCIRDIFLIDLDGCGFEHLTKLSPMLMKKIHTIAEKMYTSSTNGVHFINCPPAFNTFLKMFNAVVPKKVAQKVFRHFDFDSLYEYIPRQVLPKDYGGEEKCLKELNEKIKLKLEEYKDYFDHLDSLRVDETLRPGLPLDDELFGLQGNFKKLEVD